ncbi:hypothetical protein CYMTET_54668 [Cymbomonas tetramitiformis]|uniref:Uncharacterized protein n=1 Tax=Cymbomonas tetramitiformis TaxID=36881 RepID=A0AAE0ENS1_9CHLO|nr:hypothetical protein CYMTET_54668 [Cymbomonas tetramitiformis]
MNSTVLSASAVSLRPSLAHNSLRPKIRTVAGRNIRSLSVRSDASPTESAVAAKESSSTAEAVASEATEAAEKTEKFSLFKAMSFSGYAPETINGRLAMLGFVAGVGAEFATGENFTTQFAEHQVAFGLACGLITLASFMPALQAETKYSPNPESLSDTGLFSHEAEMMNGRAAMLGMVAMLITEKVLS